MKDGFATQKSRLFLILRNKQEQKLFINGISSIGYWDCDRVSKREKLTTASFKGSFEILPKNFVMKI